MKTIQSPEGVSLLMETLWLRHRAGLKQRTGNVYMVELPPLTEAEQADARRNTSSDSHPDDIPDDLYGAWI